MDCLLPHVLVVSHERRMNTLARIKGRQISSEVQHQKSKEQNCQITDHSGHSLSRSKIYSSFRRNSHFSPIRYFYLIKMFAFKHVLFSLLISSVQPCLLAKAVRREPTTNLHHESRITVELPKNLDRILSQQAEQIQKAPTGLGLSPRSVDFNSVLKAANEQPQSLPESCSSNPGRDATISEIIGDTACRYVEDVQCVMRAHKVNNGKRSLDLEKRVDRENSECLFNDGEAEVADMGETKYMPWSTTGPKAIGTVGLCGCTAIAIIGESGAIVSHISPFLITLDGQLDKLKESFNFNMRADIQVAAFVFSPTNAAGELVASYLQ